MILAENSFLNGEESIGGVRRGQEQAYSHLRGSGVNKGHRGRETFLIIALPGEVVSSRALGGVR